MRLMAWTCCAIAVGLIAGCPTTEPADDSSAAAPVELGVDIEVEDEGARHVSTGTQVDYKANPPASGPHWPSPAPRGFYDSPLEEEEWVHNLEHGYVVVLFDCRGDCNPELLDSLRETADSLPASAKWGYSKIVVTPYSGLPESALLTLAAWGHQLHLAEFKADVIADFYSRYLDQGPEDAP